MEALTDTATARTWPSEGAARVPAWVFSDPELFRREREVIFRGRSWNDVALSCEVPKPGDFKRSWIADMPAVVPTSLIYPI